MKMLLKLACVLLLMLGATFTAPAHARVFFGFNLGVPLYPPPYYYPPPAYYAPPPVVVPTAPPVYVERTPAESGSPSESWWYYCSESKAYYPYVTECPSPWQRVPPRPPGT
ncbi:MAG: hypothetical protein JWN13_6093 [Betaproteobacteria bacterium]|jgi:hypothetical protein|nr:hypothetical protein [Betaproteobacteria bacterium]MEA3158152.1 hypothetical protein [Betaproteobacteria bacterium]